MLAKYEVVEIEKNTWNQDGSPSIVDRWKCEDQNDALRHCEVREVEAQIQDRNDTRFEAWEDGELISRDDWEADDRDTFEDLVKMGYTEEEIQAVIQ